MLSTRLAAALLAAYLACAACDLPAEPAPDAFTLILQRAEAGEAEAAHELGGIYKHGTHGKTVDLSEAVRWFTVAADRGYYLSQYELALVYAGGAGVERDIEKGVQYLRLAADQGHAVAQFELGFVYSRGLTSPPDLAEAARYFKLAADQGEPNSMYSLGRAYHFALGVPQDFARAKELYEQADARGIFRAKHDLGMLYQDGQGVPVDHEKAFELFSQGAEAGDPEAQASLAFAYFFGRGTQTDRVQARKWMLVTSRTSTDEKLVEIARGALDAQKGLSPAEVAKATTEADAWMARAQTRTNAATSESATSPLSMRDP